MVRCVSDTGLQGRSAAPAASKLSLGGLDTLGTGGKSNRGPLGAPLRSTNTKHTTPTRYVHVAGLTQRWGRGTQVYYRATELGQYHVCDDVKDLNCSYQWGLELAHTCDHCSYLGTNPCECVVVEPQCQEPH